MLPVRPCDQDIRPIDAPRCPAQPFQILAGPGPREHQPGRRFVVALQTQKRMGHRLRQPSHPLTQPIQDPPGRIDPSRVIRQTAQLRQGQRRGGVSTRLRAVVIILHPRQQGPIRRCPQPSPLPVFKQLQRSFRQLHGPKERMNFQSGLMQIHQRLHHGRVILQELDFILFSQPPTVNQRPVRPRHLSFQKSQNFPRLFSKGPVPTPAHRPGISGDCQGIPGTQHLVVLARPDPLGPLLLQLGSQGAQNLFFLCRRNPFSRQHIPPALGMMRIHEVSFLTQHPHLLRNPPLPLRRQRLHLCQLPDVKLTLHPLAVRILGRSQPSPLQS